MVWGEHRYRCGEPNLGEVLDRDATKRSDRTLGTGLVALRLGAIGRYMDEGCHWCLTFPTCRGRRGRISVGDHRKCVEFAPLSCQPVRSTLFVLGSLALKRFHEGTSFNLLSLCRVFSSRDSCLTRRTTRTSDGPSVRVRGPETGPQPERRGLSSTANSSTHIRSVCPTCT